VIKNKNIGINLNFHPLTPERWDDFVKLFGERGACGGCWCMWWRLKRSDFEKQKGGINKEAMKKIVLSGKIPGLLAYNGDEPVGWCSSGPREDFSALERSRVLKRVDDEPVWSVVCFFIAKPYRKMNLSLELLKASVEYAREKGAGIVEGYPIEPRKDKYPDAFAYTGFLSIFKDTGFVEVERRSETRPIMRYYIGGG